jgi:hypothetical protein
MRKIIAFISISLLSLLLKNENGNCRSNCEALKGVIIIQPDLNIDPVYNSIKPYDGFFFKI